MGYLADKLDSEVELGDLHLRAFPTLRVEGADLRIRRRGLSDYPPLITIKSFHVDASMMGLFSQTCGSPALDGLDINIPPSQARDNLKSRSKSMEGKGGKQKGPAASRRRRRSAPIR